LIFSSGLVGTAFDSKPRIREITALARVASFTISLIAARTSSGFEVTSSSWRKQNWPLVTIAVSGWLTS
jgi:hypothetical protein